MPWGRIDDSFYDDPKVAELLEEPDGWAALGFWTATWSWAHRHTRRPGKIPGRLPRATVMAFDRAGAARYAGLLVKVSLWELADGGWQIHDFDQYLPSPQKRAAQSENAKKRWHKVRADASGMSDDATGIQDDASDMPRFETLAQGSMPSAGSGRGSSKGVKVVEGSVSGRASRGTRIPEDFTVTPGMVTWARAKVPHVDGRAETEKFINYWKAKSGRDATKVDWSATWRNWMLNAADRAPAPRTDGSQDQLGDGFWER